jgi:serine/threonine-protein kinase
MKSLRTPASLFCLCYLGFLGYLAWSIPQLPEKVASHFDAAGQPNGWMTRSFYVIFIASISTVVPCLTIAIFSIMRLFRNPMINIPHREFWLAPERRNETFAYLLRHAFWFASMLVAFFAGLHFLTVQANAQQPAANLNMPAFFAMLGCFLLGMLVWALSMLRHFQSLIPNP